MATRGGASVGRLGLGAVKFLLSSLQTFFINTPAQLE